MNNREGKIAHFEDVTGAETAKAHHYLESADWEIDVRQMNLIKNNI
jgi:hypothetical protein